MNPINKLSSVNDILPYEEEIGESTQEKTIGAYAIDVLIKPKGEIQQTATYLLNVKKFNEENEPDIDLELEEDLNQVLTENICEMPLDSAFLDTDLIILKDEYKGSMPINGIKEKDFKEISLLFRKICEGSSKLKLNKTTQKFLNPVQEAIKTLLTREIGRNILTKICQRETDLFIVLEDGPIFGIGNFSNSSINISSAFKDIGFIEMHPSGKLKLNTRPLYITLGHELIHTLHPNMLMSQECAPTLGREYTNMEEQMTIVGLKQHLSLNTDYSNWEPVIHKDYYNELNERNLTTAFTGGQNKWYPRNGHNSAIIRKEGNEKEHITSLIQNKVLYDLDKLFDDKTINVNELLFPDSAINIALETGEIDILKFIIKKDPSSVYVKSNGIPPLLRIAQLRKYLDTSSYLSILETLHEAKSDINATDDKGNSALYYMLENNDKEGIERFLEWGGNSRIKNKEGKTAIEYASEIVNCFYDQNRFFNLYENIKVIAGDTYIFEKTDQFKLLQNIFDFCDHEFSLSVIESYYKYKQDTKDDLGNISLHYMLASGNVNGVKKALELESNLKLKNNQGLTPIELAIKRLIEKLKELRKTLDKGPPSRVMFNIFRCLKYIKEDFIFDEETQLDIIKETFKLRNADFPMKIFPLFNINNRRTFSILINKSEYFDLYPSIKDLCKYYIKMTDINEKDVFGNNYLHQIALQSNKYPTSNSSRNAKQMHSNLLEIAKILLEQKPSLAKEKNREGKLPIDLINENEALKETFKHRTKSDNPE